MREQPKAFPEEHRFRPARWRFSFSTRRLLLIGYAALLLFFTHNPFRHTAAGEEMCWFDCQLMHLVRLTYALPLESPDKLFHFGAYLLLGLLAFWTVASYRRSGGRIAANLFCTGGWLVITTLLIWGWLDEATQPIFGRLFDWNDYLADVLGVLLATILVATPWLWRQVKSLIPGCGTATS